MTEVSLEAMLRRASRMAEKMFDEHGDVAMFWLAETASGEQLHMITPVEATPEVSMGEVKAVIIHKVRGLFRKHDVKRYVMVSAAWQGSKDSPCRPSEDPERREIVVLNAADEREFLVAVRELVRPPNGKPYLAKLGEIDRPSGKSCFNDMLPRAGRLRHSRELDDEEGRVFVTDVPGAPIIVQGRRDPRTGDLCFSGTYEATEEARRKVATSSDWIEVVTGPEAEALVAAVIKMRAQI
jgi:hypothetical protein